MATSKTPSPADVKVAASSKTAKRPAAKAKAITPSVSNGKLASRKSVKSTAPVEPVKVKHKLVRDSFTIPKNEYAVLGELKQRAARLERSVKKGEVLRAGIAALNAMSDAALLAALALVPSLKTGRPKDVATTASNAVASKKA